MMELSKLFATQGQYDVLMESEYPILPGEDRLSNKFLALQIILANLAGDCGCHQYWNRRPKSRRSLAIPTAKENGPTVRITDSVLEQFVEALQLSLSIGMNMNTGVENVSYDAEKETDDNVSTQFRTVFRRIVMLDANRTSIGNYFSLMNSLLGLAEMLGFTWEQVETSYFVKTDVRQDVTSGVEG